jgi:hypothetical protein
MLENRFKPVKAVPAILLCIGIILFLAPAVLAASLTVESAQIQSGEKAVAIYSITRAENEGGWVGFYKQGAGDGSYITYKSNNADVVERFELQVDEPGTYEFRMFSDYFGTKKIATISVNVVFSPSSSISVDKASVQAGQQVIASYSISEIDGKNTAGWIGLYKEGADDGAYLGYQKTGGVSGSWTITAPAEPGRYNFRLFKDYYGTFKLATSSNFTVQEKPFVDTREDAKTRFNSITGQVEISRDPDTVDYEPVTTKTVIRVGDHIMTGPDSGAIIQLDDMTTYVMGPNSEISIDSSPQKETKMGLVTGRIWTNTVKIIKDGTMTVNMSQAVAGIKGTTFVCEQVKGGASTLKVIEGVVELTAKNGGAKTTVNAGEMVVATTAGLGQKQSFDSAAETAYWTSKGAKKQTVIILQVGSPKLTVNGVSKEIDPGKGTKPMVKGGRTILPIRAVVEAMGGTIGWVGAENKVTITVKTTVIEMWINNNNVRVNGVAKQLDVPPQIINGRTMIPVRFISENLGSQVGWDDKTKKVTVTYNG